MSFRYQYKLFIFILLPVLWGCETYDTPSETKKVSSPYRKNLFNPYYLDQLLSSPNNFGSAWNAANIKQIVVNKISIILKGGNNPDDILEKFIYTFDKEGNNDSYNYYFYGNSPDIMNQTNFEYRNGRITKINIYKYYGVGNLPPAFVYSSADRTVFYRSKSNGKNDSLSFYPGVEKPKVIIDKIGNFVNRVEVFVKNGASSRSIKKQLTDIDTNLTQYELSEKMLTFTKNGLPFESYHLGENWNQLERAKTWEYNKYGQPVNYKEWMHGTLIKDISITYNENSLPKKITYNRKKYQLIYRKN